MTVAAAPVVLHALACHRAVDMACASFASLARYSDRPLHFVVHDDGTLTLDDRARLSATVTVCVVDRPSADERVEPLLARHPRCREFRRRNPLALKLLDVPLLAAGDAVACCDTDLLAFGPFSGVFDLPDRDTAGVFMRDTQNAYALRPWHLVASRVAVPMFVNTGLMLFRTAHHDLDFVEWFLERELPVYERLPGWLEQTAWAALAHRTRCRLYDPAQVRVVRDASCVDDPSLLIGHFTANMRGLWGRALERASAPARERPTMTVRTEPTTRLRSARLAREQVQRLAARSGVWVPKRV